MTRELTVTLETVTPLFLAGAEARGAPELRPPAFRGALRYWLRAALGGVYGDDAKGLKQVRDAEAAVFGSTDEDRGGASAMITRIGNQKLSAPQFYSKNRPPTGRDYLYWSMDRSGRKEKGNEQPPKQFYPPGGTFDFILGIRPGMAGNEAIFWQATGALWLLIHLGGVGSRSRRTAGSLSSVQPSTIDGLDFILTARSVAEIAQQLGRGLSTLRQKLFAIRVLNFQDMSEFDVLHPTVCRVWVLGAWQNAQDAVDAIGTSLREFRERREPDHTNVARWLRNEQIPTVERAAFGLPIPYRYSNAGPSGTLQGTNVERRASPLWLKISKTTRGSYVGIATLFKANLLMKGEGLFAKTRGRPPVVMLPENYALIEQWITSFPTCQEVRYD